MSKGRERQEPPADMEAGARVKAKRMRRDDGPVERDVEKVWHTEARVEVEMDPRLAAEMESEGT